MKNLKLGLVALAIMAFTGMANAGGVGYIDYAKVIDNYDYAKQVTKEVDAKGYGFNDFWAATTTLAIGAAKEKWIDNQWDTGDFAADCAGVLFYQIRF